MPTSRRPSEDAFRRLRLQRRRGGARPAQRRGAVVHQPSRLRPERVRGRDRPRHLGGAEHRRAQAAAEPRPAGALLARVDLQDGGRPGRRSKKGSITPDFRVHCSGGANFYGRYFKCWKTGGHGTVDLRHAIEQSCNVYFYTVGNMLGVDKINKWATLLGLGVKTRHRPAERGAGAGAVDRVEARADAREVVRRRDHLGRRSARGRCR